MFWETDVEVLVVFSWWSFHELWKEYCPNIRIRRPGNDTCGECTVYKNAFWYRENCKREIQEQDDAINSDGDYDLPGLMNRTQDTDPEPDFQDEDMSGDLANSFLQEDCLEQEKILEAAGFRVMQVKGMRVYVQKQTEAAIQCRPSEVPHAEREYFIVCDYAQNLPLPHYGGENPGEIYYFSALTVNLFGIVDLSLSPNRLHCYAYQ
jgi:hypothetical protein